MQRKEPANSNVLAGMKCPSCGSHGPFIIRSECTAIVSDDGVEEATDFDWGDEDSCECSECHVRFTVIDFLTRGEPGTSDRGYFTRDDWRADVIACNTVLGYKDWVAHTLEAFEQDYKTGNITAEEYAAVMGKKDKAKDEEVGQ